MPPRLTETFTDSPNARSVSITTAELDTHGVLNRLTYNNPSFQVGVSADKGSRRSMEDSHSFVFDFASIRGQGFFAVFDGHAGKHAAEWCGEHFHECLLENLRENSSMAVPDVFNKTFHDVDDILLKLGQESDGKIHSGCTAVAAFLRMEDAEGHQTFVSPSPLSDSPVTSRSREMSVDMTNSQDGTPTDSTNEPKKASSSSKIKAAFKSLSSGSMSISPSPSQPASGSNSRKASMDDSKVVHPPGNTRRVLYCANAGDARGVLCRGGNALRLTYDHKGSDKQEAKRITDAGGFVMSGRVNGVLAVTRSLGDSSMKDFVVGAPYTTETEVCDEDEFLILACDGLWDVVNDQNAVDLVRDISDPQAASQKLLKHAFMHHTQDNVTIVVVRFKNMTPRTA